MRDYSMDLAKIAAGIVVDVMGNELTATTRYSPDGNNVIIEFDRFTRQFTDGADREIGRTVIENGIDPLAFYVFEFLHFTVDFDHEVGTQFGIDFLDGALGKGAYCQAEDTECNNQ